MNFLVRYFMLVLVTSFLLRFATAKWAKYNTLLMVGYLTIAGILFIV